MTASLPLHICFRVGSRVSRNIYGLKSAKFFNPSLPIVPVRFSTSGILNHLDHLRIETLDDAKALVCHLKPDEKDLLKKALKENLQNEANQHEQHRDLNPIESRRLFIVNMMPFVGFGLLDNMIMILAGEYIDQSLGALLSISTMAAAALGNIISDVAGVGLAHYVESFFNKIGIKHPPLSSEQLESAKARIIVNTARAVGLVIGCLIGMFPLLFFDSPT